MMVRSFEELVISGVSQGISDIHISGGQPLVYRKDGNIIFDRTNIWSHKDIDSVVEGMLNEKQLRTLNKRWSVDYALFINKIRVRINVFYTTRGLSMAVRLVPEATPNIRILNLHPSLQQIPELKSGLVLICGSTGSGKSTTIAAILEEINRTRALHIVTLEDPIEFRFRPKKCFIEQREVGIHVPSFRQGLLDVLRENPDVVLVGELRDPETIRLALNAAESGHLVIASLHASSVEDAIYRISNSYVGDSDEIMRFQFASALSWLIVQQLYFVERLGFRVPALSILKANTSVRSVIRENKLSQIETIMYTSRNEGMFTLERYVNEFIERKGEFQHPRKIFESVDDTNPEPDYRSHLIDPNAIQDVVYTTSVSDSEGQEKRKKVKITEDFGQQYIIEDEPSLEELIAQMEKKDFLRSK